ncbi:hypothetical protein BBK36DRAFT_1099342, partial [Trichoderma citrinoviride]
ALVCSGSVGLIWMVSSLMWAAMQRKILLHLTAPWAGMGWNLESRRYESRIRGLASLFEDEILRDIASYAWYCLLHLVMYLDFVKSDIPLGSPTQQAIIICLIPVAIPYRFYLEWPVLTKGLILWWAQIWLRHIFWSFSGMI